MGKLLGGVTAVALLASAQASYAQTASTPDAGKADSSGNNQDHVADIVVSANRRLENSQQVPVAITAFTGQNLVEQHVRNLSDLSNLAPALRITNADAAANPKIYIRGVGLNDFNPTSSSGVGMYVDGVYVGSLLAQLASFYDLKEVEVLRGPQGTLFGRNTTGGAINITTQQPTDQQTGDLSLQYGRFNEVNVTGAVGGPIVPGVVDYRIAGMLTRDDGYSENRYTGDRVNNANRYALRGALRFQIDPDTDFTISANRFWNRGGSRGIKSRPLFPTTAAATGKDGLCKAGYYYTGQCTDALGYAETNSNPWSISSNLEGLDRIDLWGTTGTLTHKMGGLELVSVTAYSKVKRYDQENTDASPLQMVEIDYQSSQQQFTQELRLQKDTGRLKWVIGGFYENEIVHDNTFTDLLRSLRPLFVSPTNPTGADPAASVATYRDPLRQKTNSYAVFGQIDYEVVPGLIATGGLRWSEDQKTFNYTALTEEVEQFILADKKSFSGVSGRAGLRYEIDPAWNVYATYNRGYKSGGFFGGSASSPSQLEPYKNETVDAYEVGSKAEFFDRKLRANLSAFYYNYQDIQAFSEVLRNGVTQQILDNAASAKLYGGELELDARPVRHLDVSASLAYLHAYYGKYISEGDDYTGNRMPHSPTWSATGSIQYTFDLPDGGSIVPRIDMSYRTKVYFDSTQTARVSDGKLFLLNGRIGWKIANSGLEVGAWAQNITNKAYLEGISPIPSLGVDLLSYAPPRTFGAFLQFHY